jgi:hypothetical protein
VTAPRLIGSIAWTRIGLWQYLAARSADRTRLELERERSRSGLSVLAAMPPGAMVLEVGPGGMRVIKMPDQHIAAIGVPRGSAPESSGQ